MDQLICLNNIGSCPSVLQRWDSCCDQSFAVFHPFEVFDHSSCLSLDVLYVYCIFVYKVGSIQYVEAITWPLSMAGICNCPSDGQFLYELSDIFIFKEEVYFVNCDNNIYDLTRLEHVYMFENH